MKEFEPGGERKTPPKTKSARKKNKEKKRYFSK